MPVVAGEFVCPECGALLRIAQQGTTLVELNCPECETGLVVSLDHQKKLTVKTATASEDTTVSELFPRTRQPPRSYLWLLIPAGLLTLLASVLFYPQQPASEQNHVTDVVPPVVEDDEIHQAAIGPKLPAAEHKPTITPEPVVDRDAVKLPSTPVIAQRLTQIGQKVERYRALRGMFPTTYVEPNGFENHQPLSWLAGLDDDLQADRDLLPQWALNWDDPLNDRFVRRRREDLLNPLLKQVASPNRYPASHIVGMAGVGADAAELDIDHPRAGIFGWNRSTRVEDVKDGLSQTILATGITEQLASWADGSKSIRSLTAEPYINGPDGLGTGQADGMYVLLADGQVRFINRETAPVIVRRMAAMADGWPLDPLVAGEPGERPQTTGNQAANNLQPKPETPVTTEMPPVENPQQMVTLPPKIQPDKPPIDFDQLLSETVLVYQLLSATPLEQVLVELEALLGVPIEFDESQIPLDDPARKQPVSLNQKNVNYRDLLEDALESTGLVYVLENQRILIQRQPKKAE